MRARADFEETVLADVRARLNRNPFAVRHVVVDAATLARDAATTDLVVLLTVMSGAVPGRYGWRAPVWPATGLPAEAVGQNLVSALVERIEAGEASFGGPVRDGVRWLSTGLTP
jgi:hypothetical protein